MARHEFAEASAVMHRELAGDSTDLIHRATLGEIALELGRYDEADRLFQSVALARFQPDIGVRYARWLEVNGRSAEALALFETIRARQAGAFRVPAEHLAWLDLRIGEMAARNGRPGLARSAWRRGLTLLPDDPRLLRALARLGADLGSWPDAIRLGEASLARAFDPATLVLLSEAYAAAGDSRRATECGHAFEVSISNAPERMHRDWALFALDHARNVDRVLSIARQDLRGRRDIYGFDLAAWALYRSGRPAEARTYADSAVSRGTRDPGLLYRAGRIALAAGDSAMARARLSRALETNPRFHAVLADSARRLLRALGEGS
jgi:tetratricopeptide (TPR) repeat protein